ncbi:MAG: alpha/beta hydrolase [Actinomycetota bacterium]
MRLFLLAVLVAVLVACGSDAASRRSGTVEPERFDYGEDPAQYGWLRVPATDEALPVVVLIHGGFWAEPWDYTLMVDLAEALEAEGLATWNIEFRRLGGRGGWPATFDDIADAIDHLAVLADEWAIDPDRVVAAGHSSGGHLAMWAARPDALDGIGRPRSEGLGLAGAVGIAPVTDLRLTLAAPRLLGGTAQELPERWSAAAVSLDPALVEVVHGADDDIVPLFTVQNAVDAGVDVRVVEDADHFEPIEPGTEAFDAVIEQVLARVEAAS